MPDFARRTRLPGGDELATILAGTRPGVLSMTGGFPNPATFPTDEVAQLAARLVREEPEVALQYTPSPGLPGLRAYLAERQELTQGRRPEPDELLVTSGGMECITLMVQALLDPGDAVVVEAPTYLAALMAFARAEAEPVPIPMDEDGLLVDALAARLSAGLRPKFVYVTPEFQNPTGRTLPLERRHALVELCRRHGVLVLEDVAYRELPFDGTSLPSLWSLAPDVVLQAGTFSKSFFPGVRLGWATGPADVVAQLVAAKQTTDQCAAGLGQRLRRGLRALGRLRAPPAGGAGAVRLALGGVAGRADRAHARGRPLDAAGRRLLDVARAARGPRHARAAARGARGRRGLRPRDAVPRGRSDRRARDAPVVQPPHGARARDGEPAPGRRGAGGARRGRRARARLTPSKTGPRPPRRSAEVPMWYLR